MLCPEIVVYVGSFLDTPDLNKFSALSQYFHETLNPFVKRRHVENLMRNIFSSLEAKDLHCLTDGLLAGDVATSALMCTIRADALINIEECADLLHALQKLDQYWAAPTQLSDEVSLIINSSVSWFRQHTNPSWRSLAFSVPAAMYMLQSDMDGTEGRNISTYDLVPMGLMLMCSKDVFDVYETLKVLMPLDVTPLSCICAFDRISNNRTQIDIDHVHTLCKMTRSILYTCIDPV